MATLNRHAHGQTFRPALRMAGVSRSSLYLPWPTDLARTAASRPRHRPVVVDADASVRQCGATAAESPAASVSTPTATSVRYGTVKVPVLSRRRPTATGPAAASR